MCIGADDRSVMARSVDISTSGVFVERPIPVQPGEQLQLFLRDQQRNTIFRINASVVHVKPGVGFGAAFKTQNAQADLKEFIDSLLLSNAA